MDNNGWHSMYPESYYMYMCIVSCSELKKTCALCMQSPVVSCYTVLPRGKVLAHMLLAQLYSLHDTCHINAFISPVLVIILANFAEIVFLCIFMYFDVHVFIINLWIFSQLLYATYCCDNKIYNIIKQLNWDWNKNAYSI